MSAHDTVDHVCVADHCIACCPVAKSYSNGFESAREFYQGIGSITHAEDRIALQARGFIIGVVLALALLVFMRKRDAKNEASK